MVLTLEFQKFFLITKTFFSVIRSNNFGQKNTNHLIFTWKIKVLIHYIWQFSLKLQTEIHIKIVQKWLLSVNLYFSLYERRIFGTFFMGCRMFISLADGPTLWLSVAVCSSITLDFEIWKRKQSVRNWWIGETVWIVKQNKVYQIDVIHKVEGIF